MGQYYAALIRTEDGTRHVYSPSTSVYDTKYGKGAAARLYDEHHVKNPDGSVTFVPYPEDYHRWSSGVKLMEHAWFLRPFVAGVLGEVRGKPVRIAWVGDYAGEPEDYRLHPEFGIADLKACWGADAPEAEPFSEMPTGGVYGYLVNRDKGICIDLAAVAMEAEAKSQRGGALHPLPILTAIGNGRGGGDYWGRNEDKVGTWAMDMIEFADEVPEGMDVADTEGYVFVEEW